MNTLDATFKNENKKLNKFHGVGNIFVSTLLKKTFKGISLLVILMQQRAKEWL